MLTVQCTELSPLHEFSLGFATFRDLSKLHFPVVADNKLYLFLAFGVLEDRKQISKIRDNARYTALLDLQTQPNSK